MLIYIMAHIANDAKQSNPRPRKWGSTSSTTPLRALLHQCGSTYTHHRKWPRTLREYEIPVALDLSYMPVLDFYVYLENSLIYFDKRIFDIWPHPRFYSSQFESIRVASIWLDLTWLDSNWLNIQVDSIWLDLTRIILLKLALSQIFTEI